MSCETQNIDIVFNDDVNVGVIFDDDQAVSLTFNDDQNVAIQCAKFASDGFATYFEQVQDTLGAGNIVAHYKLDETSGTNAADSSGNGNDGTYTNGPTLNQTSLLTQGGGTSVDFDGTNDFVNVGAKSVTNFIHQTGVFGVSLWCDYTDAGNNQVIFATRSLVGGDGVVIFFIGASNLIRAVFTGDASTSISAAAPADGISHIVFAGDGTDATLYVNGSSVGTDTITPDTGGTDSGITPQIASASGSQFDGRIDEVTISDVEITAANVTTLYNYGTA